MKITFHMVRIGEMFTCNQVLYVKKSTRTATMIQNSRTFYIQQKANVEV